MDDLNVAPGAIAEREGTYDPPALTDLGTLVDLTNGNASVGFDVVSFGAPTPPPVSV